MKGRFFSIVMVVTLLLSMVAPTLAAPPSPDGPAGTATTKETVMTRANASMMHKELDQPNLKDYQRLQERARLLAEGKTAEAAALAQTGTDRVLVVLVEFGGPDVFTWTAGTSQWDPLGIADPDELVLDENDEGIIGDCSLIQDKIEADMGQELTDGEVITLTYEGPKHNMIEKPRSLEDRSGDSIWTSDFSPEWFTGFMFGNGVEIDYTMQDGTDYYKSFVGQSVADYYTDMSSGTYTITGDVVGWLTLPHSTWYYDADQCPGARSGGGSRGAIPEGGNSRDLVADAMDAVNAISDTIAGFNWANYDQDGDGFIDRLWIVHAGFGEEDATDLLNRIPVQQGTETTPAADTFFYGESAVWSHSSGGRAYSVTQEIAAGPYIIMPENGGIGVFAHEYGHNLGAWDLYAYGDGDTSAGFWSLMADDWTGDPIGFEPPAVDPMHLDMWGWLNPKVITDTTQEYIFTLGQASHFPGGEGVYRGAKIELEEGQLSLPVTPDGNYYWWGNKTDLSNAMMVRIAPVQVPATNATLSFDMAYDIEDGGWDFLWVMVSEELPDPDNLDLSKVTILTNDNTQCETDPAWIGSNYGFPDDLCAVNLGGFYGHNAEYPAFETETFDLSTFAGKPVYIGFWYMTDWGTTGAGPFIDNIQLGDFSADAETDDAAWYYVAPWQRSSGFMAFDHAYYLQWRNTDVETGGYDSTLGEERWRFGPANTGLLMWYNNTFYTDNEIFDYVENEFSFGPKGNTLVIDSHPEPYMNPFKTPQGNLGGENANLPSRGLMRDATFSLENSVDFTYTYPYEDYITPTLFTGRPAVSSFHDSLGYYPGFNGPWAWGYYNTVAWDASAVVPGKIPYSVKTPTGQDMPQRGSVMYAGGSWYYATYAKPAMGGTGNPRDNGAQYGWHIEILSQTDMTATVKVWNSTLKREVLPDPAPITEPGTYTLTYGAKLYATGDAQTNSVVTVAVPSVVSVVSVMPAGYTTATLHAPSMHHEEYFVWENPTIAETGTDFVVKTSYTTQVGDGPVMLTGGVVVDDNSGAPPTVDKAVTEVSLYDVAIDTVGTDMKNTAPATAVMYTVRITNTGSAPDYFTGTLSTNDPALCKAGIGGMETLQFFAGSVNLPLGAGMGQNVNVSVVITDNVAYARGKTCTTLVKAQSVGDATKMDQVALQTSVHDIVITTPEDGATVETMAYTATVQVWVTLPNFTMPADGHWNLWLNGVSQGSMMTTTTSVKLMTGTHTISAELVMPNDTSYGIVDMATFTVTMVPVRVELLTPLALTSADQVINLDFHALVLSPTIQFEITPTVTITPTPTYGRAPMGPTGYIIHHDPFTPNTNYTLSLLAGGKTEDGRDIAAESFVFRFTQELNKLYLPLILRSGS